MPELVSFEPERLQELQSGSRKCISRSPLPRAGEECTSRAAGGERQARVLFDRAGTIIKCFPPPDDPSSDRISLMPAKLSILNHCRASAPRQGCRPLAGGRAKRHSRLCGGKVECTPEGCQPVSPRRPFIARKSHGVRRVRGTALRLRWGRIEIRKPSGGIAALNPRLTAGTPAGVLPR
jgi:hypothetical protein